MGENEFLFPSKYGAFSHDGKEYIITDPNTPKPWVNVISNGSYGMVISQYGGGFSWDNHSEFNRITRWHQDLVQDNWGKYLYIKNNKTGEYWSPTFLPAKKKLDSYKCTHGIGYSKISSKYKGIEIEISYFVPWNESFEIWDVKILNLSEEEVDISIFTYFEWVLGSSNDHHREFHKLFIETEFEEKLNGLFATKRLWDIPLGDRGHWNIEYPYFGFFSCSKKVESFNGDKDSFIGQYGDLISPVEIVNGKLSKKTGAFNDSVAVLKVNSKLSKGLSENINFYLGITDSKEKIIETLEKYKTHEQINSAFNLVKESWKNLLNPLEIETPDKAMNFSVNSWFRYQAISGRLWGRTAYYQQSGAFGFRDQLQDSLVYLPIKPELTLKQIGLHARHQMQSGAVLHWWHPISETGLETKMTDDLLWLPYVVSHYIDETNDLSILDLKEPYYDNKENNDSIYEHCVLAINKVLSRLSKRGLTLIGAGDWNDGLSAVGLEMKGESVWLTEFLFEVIQRFLPLVKYKSDFNTYEIFKSANQKLEKAFNKYAWDGEWFFRASKDSGEKIGSKVNTDGKIYLNPQTWSVMTGIADVEKSIIAMESVKNLLLKNNGPLLLYPAYSKPDKFIGYLSRYAAGKRENGGVYSHAATWAIWAFAKLKDANIAYEVFKLLCPIYSGQDADKYVAEPYVMPGNIDGPDSPYYGMAGWTWYTGSANWFQKVIVDWILGIRSTKNGLLIDPCIPEEWDGFKIKRLFRGTTFNIEVKNPNHLTGKKIELKVNGQTIDGNVISEVIGKSAEVEAVIID
jgi:cellobiose phosphorylase